jgi:MFS family permease
MNKIRNAVVAAAIIGATALATLSPANAWWRWGPGPFWGGVAAGAVAGAVVGSTVAAVRLLRPVSLPAVPSRVERLRLGTQLLLKRRLPSNALEC